MKLKIKKADKQVFLVINGEFINSTHIVSMRCTDIGLFFELSSGRIVGGECAPITRNKVLSLFEIHDTLSRTTNTLERSLENELQKAKAAR